MSTIATHGFPKVLSLRVLLPVVFSCAFLAFSYQHHQPCANHNPKLKPDPQVATNFVKWWLASALDYSPSTAASNHLKAAGWLEDHAKNSFDKTFWSQSKGVGRNIIFIPSYFWPPVEKQDNTVVIGVFGDFIAQSDPKLSSQYVKLDLLVHKEPNAYRICSWGLPYTDDSTEVSKFLSLPAATDNLATPKAVYKANQEAISDFRIGNEQELVGNLKTAQDGYSQALKANPRFALALSKRGSTHYRLKENQAALKDLNEALALDQNLPMAYFNHALVRANLGNCKGSIDDNTQTIRLLPKFSYAYSNRATDRSDCRDSAGAIQDYTKAIELEPSARLYENRATTKSESEDQKGAIDDCNKAIELDPHLSRAYRTRGLARLRLKDKVGFAADIQEATKLEDRFHN
jgi:tetratricopeptide (TPR) repeat protein